MEPAEVDWKSVASRYARDETYEGINAPMWADLSRLDGPGDQQAIDVAWFCRADCCHPIVSGGELRVQSPAAKGKIGTSVPGSPAPLRRSGGGSQRRDQNLKKLSPHLSSPKKTMEEEKENQDPSPSAEAEQRQEMKGSKPRLKNTLSARNLFAGRDLLGQISDFCHEIKKMATRKERSSGAAAAREDERSGILVNADPGSNGGGRSREEKKKRKKKIEAVKSFPPTPQRFQQQQQSGNGVLQEADPSRYGVQVNEEEKENRVLPAPSSSSPSLIHVGEEKSAGMFWFLKQCK